MKSCLLCQASVPDKTVFTDLFLLKSSSVTSCSSCQRGFQRISAPYCPRCYKSGQTGVCQDCQIWKSKGHQVQHESLYVYNAAMKNYFSQYKFQGDYLLRALFIKDLVKALCAYKGYTIVPIPVSDATYRERGFNQVCAWLDLAKLPYKAYLTKRAGIKQSSLDRQSRLQRQQVFLIKEAVRIDEQILLLDDIYTTGSTLRQAQQCLLKAGAKKIKTFSLAR